MGEKKWVREARKRPAGNEQHGQPTAGTGVASSKTTGQQLQNTQTWMSVIVWEVEELDEADGGGCNDS